MAQERFTSGFAAEAPAETIKQWQEELERGFRRLRNLHGLVTNPVEPKTGQTPRVEIYKRNKSRLYRYESARSHRTPVLFVPNLRSEERRVGKEWRARWSGCC